jgi:hypothetical protein
MILPKKIFPLGIGITSEHNSGTINTDVNDDHATILHRMGFDHEDLTYYFSDSDFRILGVAGRGSPRLVHQNRTLRMLQTRLVHSYWVILC